MLLPRHVRPERGVAAGYGLFFLAHNASNVLNYAFLLAMSQALAPEDFALFAALFGGIYFAAALANTARTSVAAAVATSDGADAAIVTRAVRRLAVMGLALPPTMLVAAPLVAAFLHSDDVVSVGLVGAAIWLSLLAAVGYGGLQGSERFGLLAAGLLIASLGRLALGPPLAWLGFGVAGALLGVVIGLGGSAVLALAPFRHARSQPFPAPAPPPLLPILPAFLASVSITLPTSADVILARHYLPGPEAGAYAAVSVLGKIVVFAPMAISLLAFPRLVRHEADGRPTTALLRLSLLATAALAVPSSVVIIAVAALVPGIVLRGYQVSTPFLASYVTAMLAFSLVVLLLYASLAQRRRRYFASITLAALVVEVAVIALWHPSALAMAVVLLVGNFLLLLMGLWLTWREQGRQERLARGRRPAFGTSPALLN